MSLSFFELGILTRFPSCVASRPTSTGGHTAATKTSDGASRISVAGATSAGILFLRRHPVRPFGHRSPGLRLQNQSLWRRRFVAHDLLYRDIRRRLFPLASSTLFGSLINNQETLAFGAGLREFYAAAQQGVVLQPVAAAAATEEAAARAGEAGRALSGVVRTQRERPWSRRKKLWHREPGRCLVFTSLLHNIAFSSFWHRPVPPPNAPAKGCRPTK
mmetsp:Transcript_31461/g.72010  ORF Transcript_31461/g.72010 Transcript_31461/m.72010 type:complete len:217 (+) Transcript_31461:137-787(+)